MSKLTLEWVLNTFLKQIKIQLQDNMIQIMVKQKQALREFISIQKAVEFKDQLNQAQLQDNIQTNTLMLQRLSLTYTLIQNTKTLRAKVHVQPNIIQMIKS
jgi:hypothetical protein